MEVTVELLDALFRNGWIIRFHTRYDYCFEGGDYRIGYAENLQTFPREVENWILDNLKVEIVSPSRWRMKA